MHKLGQKSFHRYALGAKSGIHSAGKFGLKASGLGMASGAIATAIGQPEVGLPLVAGSSLLKTVSSGLERASK